MPRCIIRRQRWPDNDEPPDRSPGVVHSQAATGRTADIKINANSGLTSRAESTLSSLSDVVLCLPDAREACPIGMAPTTSTLPAQSLLASSTEGASRLQVLQVGAQNQNATGAPV